MRTYVLQDEDGQTRESHSISAGLDYPGVGPEHSLARRHRPGDYEPVTDAEAMEAFRLLSQTEGIVPAIESAHALAGALRLGRGCRRGGRPSRRSSWSTSPAGATRTSTPPSPWFDLDTRGTGSESGQPVGTDLSAEPDAELELGGASTGAGPEL